MTFSNLDEKIRSQRNTGSSLVAIGRKFNIPVSRVEAALKEDGAEITKLLSSKWVA